MKMSIFDSFTCREQAIPDNLTPQDECTYIKERISKNKNRRDISIILVFLIPIILILFIVFFKDSLDHLNLLFLTYIYAMGFWIYFILLIFKASNYIHNFESQLRDIENEIDLAAIDLDSIEKRAEKLFKLHRYELDKYYTQNLRQGNQIFIMGFIFFIVGFIIVSGSIYIITYEGVDKDRSVFIAGLGAIGTILSNFIAAIYIKMFSETAKTSTQFHNRLVTTHNLMFSNFISSKISDKTLRENTYSSIAGNLAKLTRSTEDDSNK